MGYQSYVLLCSKITSFQPSEGQFSEKSGIFSKVKIFQNPSCPMLEKLYENYDKIFFWLSWCIRDLWHTKVKYVLLCSKMTSFPPSEWVSKITFGSICSRSLWLVQWNCCLTTGTTTIRLSSREPFFHLFCIEAIASFSLKKPRSFKWMN